MKGPSAYSRGFAQGAELARQVINGGERSVRRFNPGDMPDQVPMSRKDRWPG